MKNLFIIAIVFLLSCKSNTKESEGTPIKDSLEVARGKPNQDRIFHTCASGYADQTKGSEGVAASVNVEKLSLQGGVIKSWWIGAYYYDTLENGTVEQNWVQWGYAVDRGGLFQAFYVYSIYPNYGQKWPLTIINQDNSVPLKYNTRVRFEIKRVPETTFWSFLRDGRKVLDIDLKTTSLDGVLQSCTESWGGTSFSTVIHVDYLDTYKNGVWSHLPSGNISSISWNLQGGTTRPEFKPSEHEFGGRLPSTINYLLW